MSIRNYTGYILCVRLQTPNKPENQTQNIPLKAFRQNLDLLETDPQNLQNLGNLENFENPSQQATPENQNFQNLKNLQNYNNQGIDRM